MSGFHKLHSGSALGSAHWRLSQGQVHCTCSRTCWSAVAWSYLGLWRIVTLLMVPLGSDCHWSPLVAIGGHWWPLVSSLQIDIDWHLVIESRQFFAEEWSQAAYKPELYVKTCHNLMPGSCYGDCVHVAGTNRRLNGLQGHSIESITSILL